MMRLLFLCLLLLRVGMFSSLMLSALSDEREGSGDVETDDEDFTTLGYLDRSERKVAYNDLKVANEAKSEGEGEDKLTVIIIVVAATVLALSVVAIVTTLLVRRRMHNRQQGIYSVPTEQDKKEAI
ncbi:hypothetical protein Q8A73_008082 [Channa argus]|nr:hypothetical protein Q8A73_008082 [Channa argus]